MSDLEVIVILAVSALALFGLVWLSDAVKVR
jgi:hypothetical protein